MRATARDIPAQYTAATLTPSLRTHCVLASLLPTLKTTYTSFLVMKSALRSPRHSMSRMVIRFTASLMLGLLAPEVSASLPRNKPGFSCQIRAGVRPGPLRLPSYEWLMAAFKLPLRKVFFLSVVLGLTVLFINFARMLSGRKKDSLPRRGPPTTTTFLRGPGCSHFLWSG